MLQGSASDLRQTLPDHVPCAAQAFATSQRPWDPGPGTLGLLCKTGGPWAPTSTANQGTEQPRLGWALTLKTECWEDPGWL